MPTDTSATSDIKAVGDDSVDMQFLIAFIFAYVHYR